MFMKEFTQRIVTNPPGVCPVDMQLAFLKVCHAQTCGKCVPCRIGLEHEGHGLAREMATEKRMAAAVRVFGVDYVCDTNFLPI